MIIERLRAREQKLVVATVVLLILLLISDTNPPRRSELVSHQNLDLDEESSWIAETLDLSKPRSYELKKFLTHNLIT